MVDWLEHTGDLDYWSSTLLPCDSPTAAPTDVSLTKGVVVERRQIEAYVDYYAQHFHDDPNTGRLDMFPGQALETWQCKSVPPKRSDCVTNPMPQVAGLHALLPRLIALNSTVVPDVIRTVPEDLSCVAQMILD